MLTNIWSGFFCVCLFLFFFLLLLLFILSFRAVSTPIHTKFRWFANECVLQQTRSIISSWTISGWWPLLRSMKYSNPSISYECGRAHALMDRRSVTPYSLLHCWITFSLKTLSPFFKGFPYPGVFPFPNRMLLMFVFTTIIPYSQFQHSHRLSIMLVVQSFIITIILLYWLNDRTFDHTVCFWCPLLGL